ncbi:hypothetical protein WMY93_002554 [Mugilogobius chulae]|uniref:SOCS box domain-containing protein n=1 Tax=Mugilogobius chulae TaxID=88201 RepID=A0AAW0PTX9_9GOBI
MSVPEHEPHSDTTGSTENIVVFSNPLMSDYESDWSLMHDAAFNGRILNIQKLFLRGHGDCVSLLLQQGASPTGTNLFSSPIHRAAAKDNLECIEQLVQYGADVDQHIDQSGSPLNIACKHQQPALSENCCNSRRVGPSHSSPPVLPRDSIHVLEHGADHNLRDPQGKRPLDLAPPNSLVAQLLKQVGEQYSLMRLCRVIIRKTVGWNRLSEINNLQIPNELKRYLLHQSEPRRIKPH